MAPYTHCAQYESTKYSFLSQLAAVTDQGSTISKLGGGGGGGRTSKVGVGGAIVEI